MSIQAFWFSPHKTLTFCNPGMDLFLLYVSLNLSPDKEGKVLQKEWGRHCQVQPPFMKVCKWIFWRQILKTFFIEVVPPTCPLSYKVDKYICFLLPTHILKLYEIVKVWRRELTTELLEVFFWNIIITPAGFPPQFARIFTKMSPDAELVTLHQHHTCWPSSPVWTLWNCKSMKAWVDNRVVEKSPSHVTALFLS